MNFVISRGTATPLLRLAPGGKLPLSLAAMWRSKEQ
jgi:hypothetical protein